MADGFKIAQDGKAMMKRSFIVPMLGMRMGLWLTPKAVITLRDTVGALVW